MPEKLIVANWKMYPTLSDSLVLAASVKKSLEDLRGVEVVLAPPTAWLVPVIEHLHLRGSHIHLASQNVWPEDQGAYTGEVSAYLLKDLVRYALVGHSERRSHGQEGNELIHDKVLACLRWQIRPILCVGEKKKIFDEHNETDSYQLSRLLDQLTDGLAAVSKDEIHRVVVAYEPVWAIGTKNPARPEYAQKVIQLLRDKLADKYGREIAEQVRILYGGSVDVHNASEFLAQSGIDGLLVGSVSIKARDFIDICQAAAHLRAK